MPDDGRHPHWGIEFDWFGVDLAGHVGMFSSAGYGPVPLSVMAHVEVLDAWYGRLDSLPFLGVCAESPQSDGNFSAWITAAQRGLFGYDWRHWSGPYLRLTAPSRPVLVDELPSDLGALASLVAFSVDFADTRAVDLESLGVP